MKKRMGIKPLVFGLLAAALAACGGGSDLDGRYEGKMIDLEIKGKTVTAFMGDSPMSEMEFKRDGDRLKMEAENGTLILTVNDDGSLTGMGETLQKCTAAGKIEGEYVGSRDERERAFFESGGKGRMELSGTDKKQDFSWKVKGREVEIAVGDQQPSVLKIACDGRLKVKGSKAVFTKVN